jgi:AhpD family alkylhydroperoxidase
MVISENKPSFNIRDDIVRAHERAWQRIGRAGTWFDGRARVAIAAETRQASNCAFCKSRKRSISPYAIRGQHAGLGALPERLIEQIHRIVTDPGRLTWRWFESVIASGTPETEYVEIVGVVATVVAIDTFCRAIGMPLYELPELVADAPTCNRPRTAYQRGEAWVPMIHPRDLEGNLETEEEKVLARYWNGDRDKILRALSLVPGECYAFFQLVEAQYLPIRIMRNLFKEYRAITRAQIELIVIRVSILNQCSYCARPHARRLRESGYDLNLLTSAKGDDNIPHGGLLVAFADAAIGDDDESLSTIRSEMRTRMGDAALIDAAGIVAAFNAIDRVANSTGLSQVRQPALVGSF